MIVFKEKTENNHEFFLAYSIQHCHKNWYIKHEISMTCQQIGFNNRIKTLRDIFSFVFPNVANYHQPILMAKDIV